MLTYKRSLVLELTLFIGAVFAAASLSPTPTTPTPTVTGSPLQTLATATATLSEQCCVTTSFVPTIFAAKQLRCTFDPNSMCCSVTGGTWFRCTSGQRHATGDLAGLDKRQNLNCRRGWCPFSNGCWHCSPFGDPTGGSVSQVPTATNDPPACPTMSC
jgi:hypothetical protein